MAHKITKNPQFEAYLAWCKAHTLKPTDARVLTYYTLKGDTGFWFDTVGTICSQLDLPLCEESAIYALRNGLFA